MKRGTTEAQAVACVRACVRACGVCGYAYSGWPGMVLTAQAACYHHSEVDAKLSEPLQDGAPRPRATINSSLVPCRLRHLALHERAA